MAKRTATKPKGAKDAPKPATGGSWHPGQSGNPQGRAIGSLNIASQYARAICQKLVEDPVYQKLFVGRLHAGTLGPGLEQMVWHFAYGKPKESIDVNVKDGPRLDLLPPQEQAAVDAALSVIHLARLKATGAEEVRH